MTAEPITFPYITPSARTYSPGEYAYKFFDSQNGATTAIRYGNRRTKSQLQLEFTAIKEEKALEILECYRKTMLNWNYVRFNKGDDMNPDTPDRGGAWEGIENDDLITNWYQENFGDASMTYWRFEKPPTLTHVVRGIVTVKCSFISYLDGN